MKIEALMCETVILNSTATFPYHKPGTNIFVPFYASDRKRRNKIKEAGDFRNHNHYCVNYDIPLLCTKKENAICL